MGGVAVGKPYLEDGCKWCGSQDWDDDLADVDHANDCPVILLRDIVDRWSADYHCCRHSARREGGHDSDCPLRRAAALVA
jgi:hypothetical protein